MGEVLTVKKFAHIGEATREAVAAWDCMDTSSCVGVRRSLRGSAWITNQSMKRTRN